jgi:putative membrane protein
LSRKQLKYQNGKDLPPPLRPFMAFPPPLGLGILIFVSIAEHYARVIADEGIAQKVSNAEWQAAIDVLIGHIRDGRVTAGFVAAIQRCGDVLAAHAPPDGSADELPDRLYVL